ncbi:unnamed protein product [Haemonchus placei]|uniref:Uncharacterized protein n=1 Tax=Haemonchus placei TaxID=6290 RepID=A0A0N4X4X9_HAEPC|nr:unnamed protein product [Haemonchus placei]
MKQPCTNVYDLCFVSVFDSPHFEKKIRCRWSSERKNPSRNTSHTFSHKFRG